MSGGGGTTGGQVGGGQVGGGRFSAGEICSRSERGSELAVRYGFGFAPSPGAMMPADIYIIAVSDGAVGEVSRQLNVPSGAVVAHTAGGVGMDALSGDCPHRAVIYPLQTFSQGRRIDFSQVPLFIEYATPHAGEVIRELACALSSSVSEADSARRVRLHTAAVFACNFSNHLYAIAARLLEEDGLTFDVLKPLITETADKAVSTGDPASAQTGPAVRGDRSTMVRHMELLGREGWEEYLKIYELLSQSIETFK